MLFDLPKEQQIELFGGLPRKSISRAASTNPVLPRWWIYTPFIQVVGSHLRTILIQGGTHSQAEQLSHKMRRFVWGGYPVVCLDQSGAATVSKSQNFYDCDNYERFVTRDRDILDKSGCNQVIAYGSSIGAAASIALAAEEPERVAAVIAVNPASLIRQNPWWVTLKFALSSFQKVEKDFTPPATIRPSFREALREGLGGTKDLVASDIGLNYLSRVRCPVFIYTGEHDYVFPQQQLVKLERQFPNVRVSVMQGWIHSDPNSRWKIQSLTTGFFDRFNKLEGFLPDPP